ncbi:MAG: hypothetical protein IPH79_11755 [Sphingomonadales bacterium]|nr:hypothetical protein [Sphingomonadales bacterium]
MRFGEANGPYDDQFASLLDSAITLTASSSITDGDGDTASDSETVNIGANISFADDGPVPHQCFGQQLGHIG